MTYKAPSLLVAQYLISVNPVLVDTDTNFGKMIFRDAMPVKLEGTGKRAITVADGAGLDYPTRDYGATVQLRLYADHTRLPSGAANQEDGIDRAWAMFGEIDHWLHHPKPIVDIGTLLVQSDRASGPLQAFDQQLNLPYLTVNYDVAVHTSKD